MKKLFSSIILTGCFGYFVCAQESPKPIKIEPVKTSEINKVTAEKVQADQEPVNPNAPEIIFKSEVIDYGTVEYNGDGFREFEFTNTGKEPLIISRAKGSCGCTVPTWPKEPIMPGASGKIQVKYATNRPGAFTKTVTISSNAKTPTKRLTIKGTVKQKPAGAEEEPAGLPLNKPKEGTPLIDNK